MHDRTSPALERSSLVRLKVLIILHGFGLATPRSFRWREVAKYLGEQGHQVSVVHAATGRQRLRGPVDGVDVQSVTDLSMYFTNDDDSVEGTRSASDASMLARSPFRRLAIAVTHFFRRCLRIVRWPDYAFLWTVPALVRCSRLQRARAFDAVISVSHPFSCHLVGLGLKQLWPRLHWVMDVGDPFASLTETPPNNRSLYSGVNALAEHLCFRGATAVAVTCEGTKGTYDRLFKDCAEKTTVIPPLLSDVDEVPFSFAPSANGHKVIRVLFAGSLYAAIRNPARAIEFFGQLSEVVPGCHFEVHFVGRLIGGGQLEAAENAFRAAKSRNVSYVFHGLKPRGVARGMMKAADCLLNISNTTAYQLPSKLVEFVGYGKPIVNLCTAENDASAEFLRTYSAALTVVSGHELGALERAAIKAFFTNLPVVPESEQQDLRLRFSVAAIGRRYSDLLVPGGA